MLFAEGHAKASVGSSGSSHDAEKEGDGGTHPSVTAEVNADGTKLSVTVICNASGCSAAVIRSHGDPPSNGQRPRGGGGGAYIGQRQSSCQSFVLSSLRPGLVANAALCLGHTEIKSRQCRTGGGR